MDLQRHRQVSPRHPGLQRGAAGAPSVTLLFSKREGLRLFTREQTDRQTQISAAIGDDSLSWLKLVRSGDVFTGYASGDGQQWTQIDEPVNHFSFSPPQLNRPCQSNCRSGASGGKD